MKLLAFYAAGLLMLCVMVFGGIDGFSFDFRIETTYHISETTDSITDLEQLPKQSKNLPEKRTLIAILTSNSLVSL